VPCPPFASHGASIRQRRGGGPGGAGWLAGAATPAEAEAEDGAEAEQPPAITRPAPAGELRYAGGGGGGGGGGNASGSDSEGEVAAPAAGGGDDGGDFATFEDG
jgi:hypothetical protein